MSGSSRYGVRPVGAIPLLALGAGLAACVLFLGGCEEEVDPLACAGEGIKVGTVLPRTGGLGSQGPGTGNAIQLAADEINAAGGVLGQSLIICHRDSATDADRALQRTEQLMERDVVAVIGAYSSAVSTAMLDVTGPAGLPQISVASTAPSLSDETHGTFFRTAPSDSQQGAALAQLARAEGAQSVAIIHVEGPYGVGLADVFATRFTEDATYEVTATVEYLERLTDYSDVVADAIAGGPDSLLLVAYPAEGVTIVDNLVASGYNFENVLLAEVLKDEAFIDSAGANAVDGWVGTFPEPAVGAAYSYFESAYEAAYGEPAGNYCEHAYDAMYLLALAIQHAGSTESSAVIQSLHAVSALPGDAIGPGQWAAALTALDGGQDVNYEGASGNVDFDAQGDVMGTYRSWRIVSGDIVDEDIIVP